MSCNAIITPFICGLFFCRQILSLRAQVIEECNPVYSGYTPTATCLRSFSSVTMDECSHKFCYQLSERTEKCSYPWKKPTIHREHELERIAILARNQFVTQPSCTMKMKVNNNTKSNFFSPHQDHCLGLEKIILSHHSCAVVHLNRALRGYCIWYHNICPKVQTDVSVCKRDKDLEIPTQSPRQWTTTQSFDETTFSTETMVIVGVSANFVILLIVALLVSFLLKRSRMSNRHDPLSRNPSNRPLPSVPNQTGKMNHRMSKADSLEFDKLKDESHYMYLSHQSLNVPRYHSITRNDDRKEIGSDYSYPDMEQVRQTLERASDKSCYMALMNDEIKTSTNDNNELAEKSTTSEPTNNETSNENDINTAQTQSDCIKTEDVTLQRSQSFVNSDASGEYSELKPDYYVLEENDTKGSNTDCTDDCNNQGNTRPQGEEQSHDYFQLENEEKENLENKAELGSEVTDEQLCNFSEDSNFPNVQDRVN